jgi:hypothetical protein
MISRISFISIRGNLFEHRNLHEFFHGGYGLHKHLNQQNEPQYYEDFINILTARRLPLVIDVVIGTFRIQ